ncbi:MAG: EamA family transporter [Pygmaiobacter sp.]|nr:EamA family transporter [Pygmaiobacter sp.]
MKQKASRQTVGTLLTIGGGVCWGFSGCMAQYLFESKGVTAIWLVPQRMVVAGLILVVLGFFVEGKKMVAIFLNRADLARLLTFSVFGMMMCQLMYFSAVQYSNAGTATVLQTLSPVFILLFYCLRYRRRPRRMELVAIAGALLGTFLLATHGQLNGLAITPQGLFFGLAAGVGAALYTLLSATLLNKGYSTWTVVGLGMFFSGLLLAAIVRPWSMGVVWDNEMVWMFVGIVIIGTALAFSLFLAGASIVGPLKASLLGSVEPLTAILLSAAVLGAAFTVWDFIGFVLILGVVALLSLSKGQKAD